MPEDRYGELLTTNSTAAAAYIDGVDRFFAAEPGVEAAFESAIAADPDFALAQLALARQHQTRGHRAGIAGPLAAARAVRGVTAREASQIEVLGAILEGRGAEAFARGREHLARWPRDALVAQTAVGVFGLIGFSGQPGREAAQLAFTSALLPHYGDDWWFLASHAWSEIESGRLADAEAHIEASLAQRPRNANGAHYRAHLHYENGEAAAGYAYLRDWREGYDRDGIMHTHVSWHVALWALAAGDETTMWRVFDEAIAPGAGSGPALNVLTDAASLLYRAELAGLDVAAEKWRAVSAYALAAFPKPGLAFADAHAALAHAMAGESDALERIRTGAAGPAADVVRTLSDGFGALAAGRWEEAAAHLAVAMRDHARIGGSRAQRDLIEFAMAGALLRLGRGRRRAAC